MHPPRPAPVRLILPALLLAAASAGWAKRAPDEVLVRFRPGTGEAAVQRTLHAFGGRQRDAIGRLGIRRVMLPPGLTVDRAIDILARDPAVAVVQPDVLLYPKALPNDPLLAYQWGLENIGAKLAWGMTVAGAQGSDGVIIGYLDSGIAAAHPDLAGKVLPGYDTILDIPNGEPDSGPGNDHGTFGASIAAAATDGGTGMAGVAWKAKLLPVKIYETGSTPVFEFMLMKGITWAVDHGAKVINMSLGSCNYDPVSGTIVCEPGSVLGAEVIEDAWRRGAVLVAAAGNESTTLVSYPAGYPYVLGVAATDPVDAPTVYTNAGSYIDVAAPGGAGSFPCDPTSDVLGATNDDLSACPALGFSPNDHMTGAGTSFSCPHVAGLAAVLFGQDPAPTNDQVAGRIRSTADQPAGATCWNVAYGYGRINMVAALSGTAPATAAALAVTLAAAPADVIAGQAVTIAVTVRNTGTGDAMELTPTIRFTRGDGLLVPVTPPGYVGAVVLAPGQTRVFTWTFSAAGAGAVAFTVRVSAADVLTGGSVSDSRSAGLDVHATHPAESALPMAYPDPVTGDVLKVALPLLADAVAADLRVYHAASHELVYEGRWGPVSRVEAGLTLHGVARWAPGMYLLRVTVTAAGGKTTTYDPVKIMVKR